jgi:hypothetical protein
MTPSTASSTGTGNARRITLRLLDELFSGTGGQQAGFRLWDGTPWPDAGPRPATVVLQHPGALRAMLLPGHELGLAEAYLYDDFDVEGDIENVFDLAEAVERGTSGWRKKVRSARDLLRLSADSKEHESRRGPARLTGQRHSVERDRQAVTFHYDVSNDFYALWLDGRMVYSCAYFTRADEDLDTAQARKLDYICRKLRLRPGQRLLDIGCGWGGLACTRPSTTAWTLPALRSAGRKWSWPTGGSPARDWRTAAGCWRRTTAKSRRRRPAMRWSAWGCSSTWERSCCRPTSPRRCGCCGRAAPS